MIRYLRQSDEKERWLFASTIFNAALAAAKLGWGWLMGSTLIQADGIHSISDVFGAFLIFLALHFAAHKSDRFPYGLHKLEDMAALVGGLGILFAAYEIIHSVFFTAGIKTPQSIWTSVAFIAVIIALQLVFYLFELRAAKKLASPGVRADALNWLGDIGAGVIVLVGLVAHHFAVPYAQKVAVSLIVLLIALGAYDVLKEGFLSLLDAAATTLSRQIYDLLISEADVTRIKHLHVRKSGSVHFADIELAIAEPNTIKAHNRIDAVVEKLHREIASLELVTIHYEPDHPPYQTRVYLLNDDKQTLSPRFGATPWLRLVRESPDGRVLSEELLPNPAATAPKGKAFHLAAYLISQHADVVVMAPDKLDEHIITLFGALGIELKRGA